ncbi:hypothetical protein BGZ70_007518 [Mortierella alpina]|uniref:Uncharacterized protein n=1 Tax=Mortierella alpina TaxID=64518 RepID=A0A9P6J5N4_MORAP|nr:hypothetical protein BGZ70_007518 [Mortierella alpina]
MLEINLNQDHATQQHMGGSDGIGGHYSDTNSDVLPPDHNNDDRDDNDDNDDNDFDEDDEDDSTSSSNEPILLSNKDHPESEAFIFDGDHHTSESPLDQDMTLQQQHDASFSSTNKSRLPIFRSTSSRTSSFASSASPPQESQAHALNCLEVENAYLLNQNQLLSKDMHHCRETVQALKQILAQREDTIHRMKEEYDRACMKTRFMESLLAEHSAGSLLRRADLTPSSTQSPFNHSFQAQEGLLLHIGCHPDDDEEEGEEEEEEEEEMSGDEESDYDDDYIRPGHQDLEMKVHYQEGSGGGDDGVESDLDDDDSENEAEAEANAQQRLQEIPRNAFLDNNNSNSTPAQDPSVEASRRTLGSRMYQQPNSTYHGDSERSVESPPPSHSPKTLRRRPSLKSTCTVNLSIPAPWPAPHNALEIQHSPLHNSDLSSALDCSESISSDTEEEEQEEQEEREQEEEEQGPADSLRQEGSETSDDASFHSIALKDSGHFFPVQVDFIEMDLDEELDGPLRHDEPSSSLLIEGEDDDHDDDGEPRMGKCAPNEEVSETMPGSDRVIQNPAHLTPASPPLPPPPQQQQQQQQQQQPHGHPYLKASPVAIASTLLSCIHVEASASSTTLTTGSSTSLDLPHFKSPGESDQDCESQATSTSSHAEESMTPETRPEHGQGKTLESLGQRLSYASTSSLTPQTMASATSSLATLSRERTKVDDQSGEDEVPLSGLDVKTAVVEPHSPATTTSTRRSKGNSTSGPGSSNILGFRWSGTKFGSRTRSSKAKEKAPAQQQQHQQQQQAKAAAAVVASSRSGPGPGPGPELEPEPKPEPELAFVDRRTTTQGGPSSGSILSRLWVGLGRQKSLIRANRQPSGGQDSC